ncbi:unnamed protein product [Nippostrongylus brasiliensis]|uniref:Uncharacterized protein n=1 Tax=Nippostrongylus brasiliensis TaxID=27835 RepID=A0A0N4XYJ4_NIPBR|nr:unnamed protein product [Nippostrongylus brasiliensis]
MRILQEKFGIRHGYQGQGQDFPVLCDRVHSAWRRLVRAEVKVLTLARKRWSIMRSPALCKPHIFHLHPPPTFVVVVVVLIKSLAFQKALGRVDRGQLFAVPFAVKQRQYGWQMAALE